MKKNRMMRLASGLLVAVLITTSTISGTYAKYVTEDNAADTARVAKFGVVVDAEGYLFDDTYKLTTNIPGADDDTTATLSVVSDTTVLAPLTYTKGENLVAPGTKSTDEGLQFSVTGTPEVDVNVTVDIAMADGTAITDAKLLDVYLGQMNALPKMTTGNETDTFDNTTVYNPIKFYLTQSTEIAPLVDGGTLADVKTALDALDATYDANTDLETVVGTLKLTWEWPFEQGKDDQDTLLGDIAAGTVLEPALPVGTEYNLNTGIKITITVTQVD